LCQPEDSAPYDGTQIYDTKENKWSTGKKMITPRWDFDAVNVAGTIYTVGGNSTEGSASSTVEAYDPQTNSWSKKAPLPFANAPVAVAQLGYVLAIGGYTPSSGRLADVYAYNPKTDSWSKRDPMHVGKSNPGIGAAGTTIVVAGGVVNGSGYTTDNETYLRSGKWHVKAAAPAAVAAPCSGAAGARFYMAGGEISGGVTAAAARYTVHDNAWNTNLAPMPQAQVGAASAMKGAVLYCIGGASQGYPNGSTTFYDNVQIYTP
jgi:kelch-like protein 18